MPDRPRIPTDPNLLAKYIVAQTAFIDPKDLEGKNPLAVIIGRVGGLKGGPARAKSMTAEERSESAKKAAKARWSKK